MTEAIHDAVRHSTAQTHVREAAEAWAAVRVKLKAARRWCPSIGSAITDDPKVLKELLAQSLNAGEAMASALDDVHWPRFDPARSLKTDERAHEMAARMIEEGHPELAWGIMSNAFRLACEHAQSQPNSGLNLSLYYRCEAEAVAEVIRRHYAA